MLQMFYVLCFLFSPVLYGIYFYFEMIVQQAAARWCDRTYLQKKFGRIAHSRVAHRIFKLNKYGDKLKLIN